MNRARILVLFLAIGCALIAVLMFRGLMNRPSAPPVVVEAPKVEASSVLVATKDIAIGARIAALDVEWRDWPRDNVTAGMITREARPDAIEQIANGRAKAPIIQGEPISDGKILLSSGGSLMGSLVREGLRAFAVRISARTAASGFILPNDRVDIISTVRVKLQSSSDEDDREIVFSRTIIANVRVLSINQSLAPDGPSVSEPETAVLELDPQQAEIVARSEAQGELSLALRSVSEAGDGKDDDRPVIATLSEIPNSVEMYKQGIRFLMSCEPRCDPVLQMVNVPFPLVVRDVGIENPAQKQ